MLRLVFYIGPTSSLDMSVDTLLYQTDTSERFLFYFIFLFYYIFFIFYPVCSAFSLGGMSIETSSI